MQNWVLAMAFIGTGWYVGLAILLGVLGGVWLDEKRGTSPLFVTIGLVVGVITAFLGVIKMLIPLIQRKRNKDNN